MKTLKTLSVTAILIIFNINIHSKCCEGCRTRTWNDNIAEEHTQKIKSKKSKKSKKDGKDGKLKNNKTDKKQIPIFINKTNGNLSIIKEGNKEEEDDEIKEDFTIKIKKVTVTNKGDETNEYECNVKAIKESLNGLCAIKYKDEYYSKSIYNDLMKILINDHNNKTLNEVYLYDYSKDENISLTVKTLTGREVKIQTTSNAPIKLIKELFSQKEGLQISQQKLIFAGEELNDNATIKLYKITQPATLHMVFKLKVNAKLFQNNK